MIPTEFGFQFALDETILRAGTAETIMPQAPGPRISDAKLPNF